MEPHVPSLAGHSGPVRSGHLDATVELWNAVLQQARDVGMQLGVAEALPYLAEPW
jgi:hypothetical protein